MVAQNSELGNLIAAAEQACAKLQRAYKDAPAGSDEHTRLCAEHEAAFQYLCELRAAAGDPAARRWVSARAAAAERLEEAGK